MKTLTEPEIKALSGWELSAAVHRLMDPNCMIEMQQMFWRKEGHCASDVPMPCIITEEGWTRIPAYHSDGNAMLALVAKLNDEGCAVELYSSKDWQKAKVHIGMFSFFEGVSDTLPTALCRAALLAYMKKGEV